VAIGTSHFEKNLEVKFIVSYYGFLFISAIRVVSIPIPKLWLQINIPVQMKSLKLGHSYTEFAAGAASILVLQS
jgi:hypothetical protein